MTKIHIHSKLN